MVSHTTPSTSRMPDDRPAGELARTGRDDDLLPECDDDLPPIAEQPDADDPDAAPAPAEDLGAPADGTRVIYVDVDDDLPVILDRVEESGTTAIVVLPEGARALRGAIASRLLRRRAEAAGIDLAVVTTDRALVSQLRDLGLPCGPTVGEARAVLASRPRHSAPEPAGRAGRDGQAAGLRVANAPPQAPHGRDTLPPAAPPVDVASSPPSTPAPRQRSRPAAAWRRRASAALAALLTVALGVVTWAVFFPAATVTIYYSSRPFSRTYEVTVGGRTGAIPLHTTHLTRSNTKRVDASRVQLVPDARATGTVTFSNGIDGVVIVPAGTLVDADGGVRYRTLVDAHVPAAVKSFTGTTNGLQTVGVEAVDPGMAGNLPAQSIHSVEGRLQGVLLVTNNAPMTGGTMRKIYSLDPADISAAEVALRVALTSQEIEALNSRYALSPVRFTRPARTATPRVQRRSDGDRPYAIVTVTVRTDLVYVHQEDLQRFAYARRDADLANSSLRVVPGSESLELKTLAAGLPTTLALTVTARSVPTIDTENLRAMLTGRALADARPLLDGSARNGSWRYTVSLTPYWAQRFPQAAALIQVELRPSG